MYDNRDESIWIVMLTLSALPFLVVLILLLS